MSAMSKPTLRGVSDDRETQSGAGRSELTTRDSSKERARLDRIIAERNNEMSILRQKIRDKDNQIEVALAQNALLLERRELDNRRSQTVGRVSLDQEGLNTKEEQKDVKAILEELEERI